MSNAAARAPGRAGDLANLFIRCYAAAGPPPLSRLTPSPARASQPSRTRLAARGDRVGMRAGSVDRSLGSRRYAASSSSSWLLPPRRSARPRTSRRGAVTLCTPPRSHAPSLTPLCSAADEDRFRTHFSSTADVVLLRFITSLSRIEVWNHMFNAASAPASCVDSPLLPRMLLSLSPQRSSQRPTPPRGRTFCCQTGIPLRPRFSR